MKHFRDVKRLAESLGAQAVKIVQQRKHARLIFTVNGRKVIIYIPTTPSDCRAIHNIRQQIKTEVNSI